MTRVPSSLHSLRAAARITVAITALLEAGCGGDNRGSTDAGADSPGHVDGAVTPPTLPCDDTLKIQFLPDANTHVLLVKAFKQGDPIALSNTPATPAPATAPADLCLVKLLVGPGNPGPTDAPSTSPGIGIEIWLPAPANWNERIRAYGSGGWAGGFQADVTRLGNGAVAVATAAKGYVVGTSDHGHGALGSGAFAMNPDGTINEALWRDFAERSLHELADKTKALAKAYYGKAQKYAYWDGFSTGGRQGLKLAQVYPDDFDGILAGAPAIHWSRFITGELYPQIVLKRDLGASMSVAKLNAVSTAAVAACGGTSLGFLLDPFSCRYDPTRDATALCSGVAGNGGVIGANPSAATCVSLAEATAINKIWYGQTADGTVRDPALDNATGPSLSSNNHLWFGLTRGSFLGALAGPNPFPIATDQVALELQDPRVATASFVNATGNGSNQWTTLDYTGLTVAALQGAVLQPRFSNINTDNADLGTFNARGGKLILYHGLADILIPPQGSTNYYSRVTAAMGGIAKIQTFFRFYLIPGFGHGGSGSLDPATGALTSLDKVPLPQNALGRDELFKALEAWVENGTVPGRIDVSSAGASVSLPLCVYPEKITYRGSGAATEAASYACQ
jgi:feruloyl esterase